MSLYWYDDLDAATRAAAEARKPLLLNFALPG